jgi:Asp-tRNA(Asn)/Glu-tRNA(Gln) amidotransferase A subunit family amidase
MRRRQFIAGLGAVSLIGAFAAAEGPAVAQAQGGSFPVEEVSIADLEAAYLAGRVTARAVTQAHLDRIAAYDKRGPLINSLVNINPRALEDADRLDASLRATGRLVGPLHGCRSS